MLLPVDLGRYIGYFADAIPCYCPPSPSLKNNFVIFFCLFGCYSVYFILFLFTSNAVLLFFYVKPLQTEASLIHVFIVDATYVKVCLFPL